MMCKFNPYVSQYKCQYKAAWLKYGICMSDDISLVSFLFIIMVPTRLLILPCSLLFIAMQS